MKIEEIPKAKVNKGQGKARGEGRARGEGTAVMLKAKVGVNDGYGKKGTKLKVTVRPLLLQSETRIEKAGFRLETKRQSYAVGKGPFQ